MKKKILYGISVLAIAAVATVNVSVSVNLNSQNSHNLSDIQLANVEALAQEPATNVITCYNTVRTSLITPNTPEPIWNITFCNGCSIATCYEYRDSGTCTVNSGFRYV